MRFLGYERKETAFSSEIKFMGMDQVQRIFQISRESLSMVVHTARRNRLHDLISTRWCLPRDGGSPCGTSGILKRGDKRNQPREREADIEREEDKTVAKEWLSAISALSSEFDARVTH
nr:PREDICTED: uncharacterized protein LOC105661856 [Megachile rotundata]